MKRSDIIEWLNGLALLGLSGVLLAGFAFQFALGELPCPLCLLQRVAFACAAFGFLLNVRYGRHPTHYGIILCSALYGMAVSGRQVLLHIVPGSGAYGSAIFGLHFYTWAFVLFGATILGTAILLMLEDETAMPARWSNGAARWIAVLAICVTAANAVATLAECGPVECPDNPTGYWLLNR